MLRISKEIMNRGFDADDQLKEVLTQVNLMKSFATMQGMRLPKEIAGKIAKLASLPKPTNGQSGEEPKSLGSSSLATTLELAFDVHGTLSELVKPATPESIEASTPRKGWARILWPRVTDILISVTLLAVVAFTVGTWLKVRYPGIEQLAFLGAALLGATFSGLYTAYNFICDRTFDPASGTKYMTRVVLGAISGLILANLGIQLMGGGNSALKTLGPAALALVGGYSADAVNLILKRVADTLVATVRGSGDDAIKAKDDAIKAKQDQLDAESKITDMKQRQATVDALGQLLKEAPDMTMTTKDAIQRLMAKVGQGEKVDATVKAPAGNGDGAVTAKTA